MDDITVMVAFLNQKSRDIRKGERFRLLQKRQNDKRT